MSQLRDRRSGARGIARGLSLLPLLALALSAGAARAGEIRGRHPRQRSRRQARGGPHDQRRALGDAGRRSAPRHEGGRGSEADRLGRHRSRRLLRPDRVASRARQGKDVPREGRGGGRRAGPLRGRLRRGRDRGPRRAHPAARRKAHGQSRSTRPGKPLAGAEVSLEAGRRRRRRPRVPGRDAQGRDGRGRNVPVRRGERAREPHHDREGGPGAHAPDGPQGRRDSEADRGRRGRPGRRRRPRRRQEARRGRPREAGERRRRRRAGSRRTRKGASRSRTRPTGAARSSWTPATAGWGSRPT